MLKADDGEICRLTDIFTQQRAVGRGGART